MENLRKKIEHIDEELLTLIEERVRIAKEIGTLKKKEGKSIRNMEREKKVIKNWKDAGKKKGLSSPIMEDLAKDLIKLALSEEKREGKIAILGPEGTFTHEAAINYFGTGKSVVALPTISAVFGSVENDVVDYGVVPAENVIEGSVNITLDELIKTNLKIMGEVILQVVQNLITDKDERIEKIRLIMSHPQGLAQCREYLRKNFPEAEYKETSSTAKAVSLLRETKHSAAIGTELAARIYGKKIVAKSIQDLKNNMTRFFVISKTDHKQTGKDKTSVVFTTKDKPGALFSILEEFAKRKINLTKIESRPSRLKEWEYLFFLDFEGHREEKKCREALKQVEKNSTFFKILGSYPKAR